MVARQAHNLEVAGSNPVPASLIGKQSFDGMFLHPVFKKFIVQLNTKSMAAEKRTSRAKITVEVAPSLREKANRKAKKQNTSLSQVLRDFLQSYVKR
ncbi:omega transcriptional repressor [Pseudanabaena phage Pan5]|nr:omega transcriptional repressor [Pseudanabaena phage Pan5]